MTKKGFTLVELLAVIVILGIILAIAIPAITGIVNKATRDSFASDIRMFFKAINYAKLQDDTFQPINIKKDEHDDNILAKLNIASDNYERVQVIEHHDRLIVVIYGQNKWEGLVAYGDYHNVKVVASEGFVLDLYPPEITILGDNPTIIAYGIGYIDAGATAWDDIDGDVTNRITIINNVDYEQPGIYTVTYIASDNVGNQAETVRTVRVIIDRIFSYTGNVQQWVSPLSGRYRIEVWGAEGGGHDGFPGGLGGYAWGEINLNIGDILYFYVGQGGAGSLSGTRYNGGGSSGENAGSGGGSTDVRTISGAWNNSTSLNSRIIVGGGGGGGSRAAEISHTTFYAGGGGGLTGVSSGHCGLDIEFYEWHCFDSADTAGTQITAGSGGGVGFGKNGTTARHAGGGGGYYGGGNPSIGAGGGGSSYIGGMINDGTRGTQAAVRSGNGSARIRKLE
jgi:prepilin-type N-terminal cleavage/methylation domain-containing protein